MLDTFNEYFPQYDAFDKLVDEKNYSEALIRLMKTIMDYLTIIKKDKTGRIRVNTYVIWFLKKIGVMPGQVVRKILVEVRNIYLRRRLRMAR